MKKENFYPLSLTRPVEELRCGAVTLGEKKRKHTVEHIWDLVRYLGEDLAEDISGQWTVNGEQFHQSIVFLNQKDIRLENEVEIEPCAVLDARQGPIYIAKGTIIKAHANLRGPLYIGSECRIGGEVSHSIFHGYSNKAHYGFIGHSYIGEWVNLGAGTTNSNLKNTYGTIKVTLGKKEIDTGLQFCGSFIGDHAKTGIGTLITTGAVIGVGANIFGGGVTDKVVKSFTFGGKKYKFDKFISTTEKAMGRRGKNLSEEEKVILSGIYKAS